MFRGKSREFACDGASVSYHRLVRLIFGITPPVNSMKSSASRAA
jgi:hypothetical protein